MSNYIKTPEEIATEITDKWHSTTYEEREYMASCLAQAIRSDREVSVSRTVLDNAYAQRNILAILCAHLLGGGVGKDLGHPEWDEEWKTVVYFELEGTQISFHMAPSQVALAAHLPTYHKSWDGTFESNNLATHVCKVMMSKKQAQHG